jgi:hypothetical protein
MTDEERKAWLAVEKMKAEIQGKTGVGNASA